MVDSSTDTVYVVNLDNTVSVIDGATATVTATGSVGRSPAGIAVDPSTDTVYVSNSADGTVSVINGQTNTVSVTIDVGGFPTTPGVDPGTGAVSPIVVKGLHNGDSYTFTVTNATGTGPSSTAGGPQRRARVRRCAQYRSRGSSSLRRETGSRPGGCRGRGPAVTVGIGSVTGASARVSCSPWCASDSDSPSSNS